MYNSDYGLSDGGHQANGSGLWKRVRKVYVRIAPVRDAVRFSRYFIPRHFGGEIAGGALEVHGHRSS